MFIFLTTEKILRIRFYPMFFSLIRELKKENRKNNLNLKKSFVFNFKRVISKFEKKITEASPKKGVALAVFY